MKEWGLQAFPRHSQKDPHRPAQLSGCRSRSKQKSGRRRRLLNSNPISIGNGAWDIKEILGDVDIHEDGSALFEVPAMESIYLQVLDAKGRVIQNTRTWDTVRPGEKKGCKGCHSTKDANFHLSGKRNTMAWKQAPQQIQPSMERPEALVSSRKCSDPGHQCVSCHDGSQEGVMSLNGDLKSHGTLESAASVMPIST